MNYTEQYYVLRFDKSSGLFGQFVDLDQASGGYPYGVAMLSRARRWGSADEALEYAKHFPIDSRSYAHYAIEPVAYLLTMGVDLPE